MTGGQEETWQVAAGSGRFNCDICGKTHNTRNKMEKHMKDHEEDIDDASHTCSKCSYQTISRDDLVQHLYRAHGIQVKETCTQCDKGFLTQGDLNQHIRENHKSHKRCDYLKVDRCDLEKEECRFKHIKLKPGEQICFTCGKIFISKREMLSHIREKHGNTLCHRFLRNECTVRRCLFSHIRPRAANVETIFLAAGAQAPPSQDFPNLHATRPVMWSQVVANNPQPAALPTLQMKQLDLAQIREVTVQTISVEIEKLLPQILRELTSKLSNNMKAL